MSTEYKGYYDDQEDDEGVMTEQEFEKMKGDDTVCVLVKIDGKYAYMRGDGINLTPFRSTKREAFADFEEYLEEWAVIVGTGS